MGCTVWVVGRVNPKNCKEWQMQGIFNSKEQAIHACQDEYWFIGEVIVDVSLPDEEQNWPGVYYPLNPYDPRGKQG